MRGDGRHCGPQHGLGKIESCEFFKSFRGSDELEHWKWRHERERCSSELERESVGKELGGKDEKSFCWLSVSSHLVS